LPCGIQAAGVQFGAQDGVAGGVHGRSQGLAPRIFGGQDQPASRLRLQGLPTVALRHPQDGAVVELREGVIAIGHA